jgi:O-antigen/teichoic acid export membrane protein
MISILFIFQFINIILSRIEGPEVVTQYNIAFKYFNILNMLIIIVLTPFWSAFTDAYVRKDFSWMRIMVRKLEKLWLLCIPFLFIMIIFSDFLYKWWIGDSVHIPLSLSVCVAIYMLFQVLGNIYMYMINGTSKVRVQLIVYLFFSIIAIPLMNLFCNMFGVIGILIIPTIVFIIQAILGKIQINKIINSTANGIWNK